MATDHSTKAEKQKLKHVLSLSSSSSSSSPSTVDPRSPSLDITASLLRDLATFASHQESEEDKELKAALEEASLEAGVSLPPAVASTVLLLFGKVSGAPDFRLAKWLASARKRSRMFGPLVFPTRKLKATNMFSELSNDSRSDTWLSAN